MKKLFLTTLASLVLTSAFADPITPQKAMQIAQQYLVPGYTMNMKLKAKAKKPTTQNAPYYIISRGENQGYVIVAGDDCLSEVLGYTDCGGFDPNDLPPALEDMLAYWQMAVETAQADGSNVVQAKVRKAQHKAPSTRKDIAPFVTSHWHQSSPYNDICPLRVDNGARAMTGCVATAASQILYYWRKDLPSTLQSTTPTYSYGNAHPSVSFPKGHPVKWDLMLDQYGSESREYKQAVAEFVYCVGTATWLTYADGSGTATSGNIEKIPATFSSFFGMHGGEVKYRNSYSQEAWTQLIYNELAAGRPVMYTGVHPSNGGHAVFIHGYQASTDKMYFNFGWGAGNGYDGYYTTDETTGMNGFYDYQSCLVGAYPKHWNMDVSMIMPKHLYAKVDNDITVKIENNSTLDLKGVYMFVSTSITKPTDLSKTESSDTETVFGKGTSNSVVLSVKPTTAKTTYVTVTDANLNVLSQQAIEVETSDASIAFEEIEVLASSDKTILGDYTFSNIYNANKALINLTVSNHGSSAWGGSAKVDIYSYDEATGEWTFVKNASNTKAEVAASGNSVISLTASSLETGKYYYATCSEEWGIATQKTLVDVTEPKVAKAYFTLKGADMEVVGFENNVLTLKGHFDQATFISATFAKKNAYKTATVYDLTQCTGVSTVSQDINPNALYYVSDDSEAEGTNIIKAGKCAHLSLVTGYNFTPRADFTAAKAEMFIGGEPSKWQLVTVPFNATVPDGIIAREDTLYKAGLKVREVRTLEAGKTYLMMASSPRMMVLSGEDTQVLASPAINADPSMVATYTNVKTPAGAMLIYNKDADKEYFHPVEEGSAVEALRGYFLNAAVKTEFRAYTNLSLDPAYLTLSRNITSAYETLDKYADIVTAAAYKSYLAEIKEAENVFAARSIETVSQVKALASKLLADGEVYMKQISDVGNSEVDFTGSIENPSFETKTTKGWTLGTLAGVTTVGSVYDGTKPDNHRAVGLDGTYAFQSLITSADSASVGIQQEVKGLTPGYYRLTAMVGTDDRSEVTVFAGDSIVSVPGHSFGHLYLSKAIINNVLVEAAEGSDTGSLLIGIMAGRWYKADNFTLTYVGSIKGDDVVDCISTIASDKPSVKAGIYTIMGVKVEDACAPGIYIIDGRKVMK